MGVIVQDKSIINKKEKYSIIIVGAGGFGREIYLWAKETFPKDEYLIKGFLDDNIKALNNYNIGIKIIESIINYLPEENDRFLIAIGEIQKKKELVTILKSKNAVFQKLIHPTAKVAKNTRIGEGVIICPFCLVSDHVVLDNFTMMNIYSSCGHDVNVGKYCILSPYYTINGFGIVEDEVFLGTHSTVIPGKKVGHNSKVSANSVVMRNVPSNKMVFGVPGKIV